MLGNGDRLPAIRVPPPGPRSRSLSRGLLEHEAPGINTLFGGQPSIVWQEAVGANVLDVDGNRYVDLTAGFGVAALGHRNPRIGEAIRAQSERLIHGLADVYAHPARIELAEALCRSTRRRPFDEPQVYFAVSGADAVEIALKTAQLSTGRPSLVAFEPSYHGLTLGALEATSRAEFRRPFLHRLSDRLERLPFGCDPLNLRRCLDEGTAAAVIVEPIVGREGVLIPPSGWLTELDAECKRSGTLLIVDEIFTGFGRTGARFAFEHEPGVRPDLVCCGKALGGGLPIGAVLGERATLAAWQTPGEALHTGTFVAHPLACAAALAFLSELEKSGAIETAARHEVELRGRLADWQRHPSVADVRGRGLLWGIELSSAEAAHRLAKGALERGVIALAGGSSGRVLQLCPPLTIERAQLDASLDVLEEVLQEVHALG